MINREYRPTLAQLRTFVTVAENKHFGTAAAKLSISQPSLSQALVALETGLGVQLIERSTRRVIITPTGERLLPYAKATLDAADSFFAHARGTDGFLSGPICVGMIPTIAPYILPTLLQECQQQFPKLEPQIVERQTEGLVSMLRDGNIDVAIIATSGESGGLTEVPLYDENFHVIVPEGHRFAGNNELTLDALQELDLILLDDGHCLRDQIVDLCKIVNINPTRTSSTMARVSSLTTVMQCVAAGMGSTLIPESALATEAARPGIATAQFAENVVAKRTVGLLYRTSSSRADEFKKFGELVVTAFTKVCDNYERMLNAAN